MSETFEMSDGSSRNQTAAKEGATERRQCLMKVCADANAEELARAVGACGGAGGATDLRPVETGLIMLQGRIGGNGAPFNVGEATVTRAVVLLPSGEVGYGYRLGRDKAATRLAALVDAYGQKPSLRTVLETEFVTPVRERVAAERAQRDHETAATRVNFFTLARGED